MSVLSREVIDWAVLVSAILWGTRAVPRPAIGPRAMRVAAALFLAKKRFEHLAHEVHGGVIVIDQTPCRGGDA